MIFAILSFGIVTLMLSSSGNNSFQQIFISTSAQQENEAEIKADIEQENKCKKDTECENENEVNNSLNITGLAGIQGNGNDNDNDNVQPGTCLFCFAPITNDPPGNWPILDLDNLNQYLEENIVPVGNEEDIDSVEELCDALENTNPRVSDSIIAQILHDAIQGDDQEEDNLVNLTIECLRDLGLLEA